MSKDETYNGWTNRETWAVALHINNDQGWQESVHDLIRTDMESDPDGVWNSTRTLRIELVNRVADIVRENVDETLDGFASGYTDNYQDAFMVVRDIGSWWRINWTELGEAFLRDLEDES